MGHLPRCMREIYITGTHCVSCCCAFVGVTNMMLGVTGVSGLQDEGVLSYLKGWSVWPSRPVPSTIVIRLLDIHKIWNFSTRYVEKSIVFFWLKTLPCFPVDIIHGGISLQKPLKSLLNLRIEKAIENSQKDTLE